MLWELSHQPGIAPAFIPLSDFPAGLMYGMAVYTTFRVPLAERWLHAHLDRLATNVAQMGMPLAFPPEVILQALALASRLEQPVLRLTAVADVQEYGDFYGKPLKSARLLLSTRQAPSANPLPLALKSVKYVRPTPLIKHLAMAEVIALKQKARLEGFQDILLSSDAQVSEASTANIFFIQSGKLFTPNPERDGCLPGITRQRILEAAQAHDIFLSQDSSIQLADLPRVDGAFLTNAVQGIRPVAHIDNITLPWPDSARELVDRLAASLA